MYIVLLFGGGVFELRVDDFWFRREKDFGSCVGPLASYVFYVFCAAPSARPGGNLGPRESWSSRALECATMSGLSASVRRRASPFDMG